MRLINAEHIEKAIAEWKERETNELLTMTIVENVGTWITHAPTVEAIPIEWLMKWEKEHTWEYESYFREIGKYPIECAIEDWRKENETN